MNNHYQIQQKIHKLSLERMNNVEDFGESACCQISKPAHAADKQLPHALGLPLSYLSVCSSILSSFFHSFQFQQAFSSWICEIVAIILSPPVSLWDVRNMMHVKNFLAQSRCLQPSASEYLLTMNSFPNKDKFLLVHNNCLIANLRHVHDIVFHQVSCSFVPHWTDWVLWW